MKKKITRIKFKTDYQNYDLSFSSEEPMVAVISQQETERRLVTAAAELTLYKRTNNPYGHLVRESSIYLDNGDVHGYPLGRFDQEGELLDDNQQFQDHVLGLKPFDMIEFARHGPYESEFNAMLQRLSQGRFTAVRWDTSLGLVVATKTGGTRSIFAMSEGELEIIKVSARLVDLRMGRYPVQFFTSESLTLLDQNHMAKFCSELAETIDKNMQVLFVCKLVDILDSSLAELPGLRVIELDTKEGI